MTQFLKAMSQKYFMSKWFPILEILGHCLLFVPLMVLEWYCLTYFV